MTFTFRPAIREEVGLILGLIGCSGAGKTFSALRLASGIAGDKPFCVIDTEAGRAKHYADRFKFDHGDLKPPFRPGAYADAIKAADAKGYPVIVVDSCSHEHAGEGGILDWHEEELGRMAGDDWKKREACKMAAWIKPKMEHKQMVQRLLQVRAHLILCFRAEEKVKMERNAEGKTIIVPQGWQPICEKNLPYELTASFLLTPDAPGIPKPIKLQEQHRALFPLTTPISEEAGRRLAQWASGAAPKAAVATPAAESSGTSPEPAVAAAAPDASTTRAYPFYYPGMEGPQDQAESPDEWFKLWQHLCDTIVNSTKIDPAAKDKKIRDLRKANEQIIKRFGAQMMGAINADIAKRSRELKEAALTEPAK